MNEPNPRHGGHLDGHGARTEVRLLEFGSWSVHREPNPNAIELKSILTQLSKCATLYGNGYGRTIFLSPFKALDHWEKSMGLCGRTCFKPSRMVPSHGSAVHIRTGL